MFGSDWSGARNIRDRLSSCGTCAEIKADKGGIADYEVILRRIAIEREMLTVRLEHNRAWAHKFDADVGPFEKQYDRLTEEIGTLYDDAKTKHARGLQVLVRGCPSLPTIGSSDSVSLSLSVSFFALVWGLPLGGGDTRCWFHAPFTFCALAVASGRAQMDEFHYHPAFRRAKDNFTAVPFRPK